MKTVLAVFLLVAASAFAADSLQQQVESKEREELDALKSANYSKFADLIADDAVFLDPHGSATKKEVVDHVGDFKLLDFTMEDVHFVKLSETSGVLAYKLTQKGIAQGHEFTNQVYASAVWVQRNGKWVTVFSQETPSRKSGTDTMALLSLLWTGQNSAVD